MSQTTAVSPAASIPTVSGRVGDARASLIRAMSGSPGRLRVLTLLAVAVSLIFAIAAYSTFEATDGALLRGGDNTAQLVRIQAIHTNLVRADADATNAFLVGGLEPADQRASYLASMSQASNLIAEAAKAQPADGAALGALYRQALRTRRHDLRPADRPGRAAEDLRRRCRAPGRGRLDLLLRARRRGPLPRQRSRQGPFYVGGVKKRLSTSSRSRTCSAQQRRVRPRAREEGGPRGKHGFPREASEAKRFPP